MSVQREDAGSPDPTRTNVNDWMLPAVLDSVERQARCPCCVSVFQSE